MNTTNIRAVLIDDEPKAIDNLSILLQEYCTNVTIVGTAKNVDNAVTVIENTQPDVVFLDIEMPKKSGFELFKETNQQFKTIFVTAYNQYAVKAFEVSAVDYLLKPVNINRLQQAVAKIQKETITQHPQQIKSLQENLESEQLQQITIKHKGCHKILTIQNIICIEASQAYSIIYYLENNTYYKYTHSRNLSFFESLFENGLSFFRIHRSWIINTAYVENFSATKGEIVLKYDILVLMSKRKFKEFKKIF